MSVLQGNEARLYEYVVRHFLACCSQDAKGQETTVEVLIDDEKFKASGLMILARNYLEVYTYESWSNKVSKAIPCLKILASNKRFRFFNVDDTRIF